MFINKSTKGWKRVLLKYVFFDTETPGLEKEAALFSVSDSLTKCLELGNDLLRFDETWDSSGRFPQESIRAYEETLCKGLGLKNNVDAYGLLEYCSIVIEEGINLISSIKQDTNILDNTNKKIVFSPYRRDLIKYVFVGKCMLTITPELFTNNAKQFLKMQINHAEICLANQSQVPFIRNRQFGCPDANPALLDKFGWDLRDPAPAFEEAIRLARRHYSMTYPYYNAAYPGMNIDRRVEWNSFSGLEPAVANIISEQGERYQAWYPRQNYLRVEKRRILNHKTKIEYDYLVSPQWRYELALQRVSETLRDAKVGSGVGEYAPEAIATVKDAVDQAKNQQEHAWDFSVAVVNIFNKLSELRASRGLRCELEPKSNIFFAEKEMKEFKSKVKTVLVYSKALDRIKSASNRRGPVEQTKILEHALKQPTDYDKLNQHFTMFDSKFTTIRKEQVPPEAAYATLQFIFPSENNEASGLGHIWLDEITIKDETNVTREIPNGSFEQVTDGMPEKWKFNVVKGNPILKVEERANYVKHGSKSVYIENPTKKDLGILESNKFKIPKDSAQIITYAVKQDGRVAPGQELKCVVTFFATNAKHAEPLKETTLSWQKKSLVAGSSDQDSAIVYALTGDYAYAEKAKNNSVFKLNDFCQGLESWKRTNTRPDGSDAYGAVQGGRFGQTLATVMTFIKNTDLISTEEWDAITSQIDYLMASLIDFRDLSEASDDEIVWGTGNWQTDMALGAATLIFALGDKITHSKQLLNNALMLVKKQIDNGLILFPDGSYNETVRYLGAILSKLAPFVKILRNCLGEDLMKTTDMWKLLEFLIQVQAPYSRYHKSIDTPTYGDHNANSSAIFAYAGVFCDEVADFNISLASQLYDLWHYAGKPMPPFGPEDVHMVQFYVTCRQENYHNNPMILQSTTKYKNSGIHMLRNNYGRTNELLLTVMAGNQWLGHGHYDQGAIALTYNGINLVIDPGVYSYFDGTTRWFVSSQAHATVQFDNGSEEFYNTPRTSQVLAEDLSHPLDYLKVKVESKQNHNHIGTLIRHVFYIKNGINAIVIYDEIVDCNLRSRLNMPVSAIAADVDGNCIDFKGHFDTHLQMIGLQPACYQLADKANVLSGNGNLSLEWGGSSNVAPKIDGAHLLKMARVYQSAGENFLTVLYPYIKQQKKMVVEKIVTTNKQIKLYKLTVSQDKYVYLLVNNHLINKEIKVAEKSNLINMATGVTYNVVDHQVCLQVEQQFVSIFRPASLEQPKAERIEIQGDKLIAIPNIGERKYNYRGLVMDQYDDLMATKSPKLKLISPANGVTLDKSNRLCVRSVAGDTAIILQAEYKGVKETTEIKLKKN